MTESRLKTFLKRIKYRLVLKFKPRVNRVYTQFYRFPNQYKALVDEVLPNYLEGRSFTPVEPFEVLLFASSTGAEPFSLAYILKTHFPDLHFRIRAHDIVDDVLAKAKSAKYTEAEVRHSPFITDEFIDGVFDQRGGDFHVKPELVELVEFDKGDMLDKAFMESLGTADLVVAQNVLFHLPAACAKEAFAHLYSQMKPEATLLVNGLDMGMRVKLSKKYNLQPVEYLLEEIHDDARVDQGGGWAGVYWGREPLTKNSKEWVRKYCTIFTRAAV